MKSGRSVLPRHVDVTLDLDEPDEDTALAKELLRRVGPLAAARYELERRSLDARGGRVRRHFRFELVDRDEGARRELGGALPREVERRPRAVVVGDGPAGLFCAYELARAGIGSVVLDRGKPVQPRRRDLRKLHQEGAVDADSNYCFGEGGAGTYSDGKLYTRSTKRGDVRDVLEILALHGAPEEILVDARPHIGSNRLPQVVSALRARLESVGVEFRFGERVTELVVGETHAGRRAIGVRTADDGEWLAPAIVVATGHSARDVFVWLGRAGARLEAKPFAVGVRIEHPQALIDRAQYASSAGHPKLPAAAYGLATNVSGRGVFSFCMCPGGFVVPAATEAHGVVLNGMSLSRRDSRYANAGIVVATEPLDVGAVDEDSVLAGVAFQRAIEERAYQAGGGALRAPALRVTDFLARRISTSLPACSYIPGAEPADLEQVFDPLFALGVGGARFSEVLREALRRFGRRLRGFDSEEALLLGVETRTSSPVRVLRDPTSLMSVTLPGLYPAGEGAGYAGGIVSAALDGQRVARAILAREATSRT